MIRRAVARYILGEGRAGPALSSRRLVALATLALAVPEQRGAHRLPRGARPVVIGERS